MVLEDLFCSSIFKSVHPYFYPSTKVFTRPNDGSLHKAMGVQNDWNSLGGTDANSGAVRSADFTKHKTIPKCTTFAITYSKELQETGAN